MITQQSPEPHLVQQDLLVSRFPERANLLGLAPEGPDRGSQPQLKEISSQMVSFPCDPPDQSNVKQDEVIRHPRDGDFPEGTPVYW